MSHKNFVPGMLPKVDNQPSIEGIIFKSKVHEENALKIQEHFDKWTNGAIDIAKSVINNELDKLSEARKAFIDILALHVVPDGITITKVDMGGVPGTLIVPDNIEGDNILYQIHGGAYTAGSPDGYHGMGGYLAKFMKAKVYMPDYRKAPEFRYPAPIDDVFTGYKWLLDQGNDPDKIVFSGDSAGGAMVVSVMVRARNAGLPLPAGGALFSPWVNLEGTGESMFNRDGYDPHLTKAGLDYFAKSFVGNSLLGNPDASPVYADVTGLPPIIVQIGENEIMLSDAMKLATRLGNHRVRVTLEVWPDMFHIWHLFAGTLPEATEALENAAIFLTRALRSKVEAKYKSNGQ